MPRLKNATPKYRKHRASGQAIVTIEGQDFYLGPHGSRPSRREYERLVGEWLQNGRSLPAKPPTITIPELINAYRKHAEAYYVKDGQSTGTAENMRPVMRFLRRYYGDTPVGEFGPLALKSLRQRMIEDGQARKYVNENVDRIRRMFKWAAGNEMIPFEVYQRLTAVDGLRKGRTEARETAPVPPVSDDVVEATLPHLPAVVADMVRFQRLTGCRPGEVCILRPCDVDTSGDVWIYRPESHKTEHHGRDRIIAIGPKAQEMLRPYLLRAKEANCFSPADSEQKRRREQHDERVTPLTYGNRPGTNRRRKPKRSAGDCYTNDSYRRAIHRACDKAFPSVEDLSESELKEWRKAHRWSPNQLRHTAATEIRKQFGLEAAQVTLGHSNANVTQIYAERDLSKAAEIMRQVG
jgi:integrase